MLPKSRAELRSRQIHQNDSCLYFPYICEQNRKIPDFCSSCKVKISSMYAQNGIRNTDYLFEEPCLRQPIIYIPQPYPVLPQPQHYIPQSVYSCPPPRCSAPPNICRICSNN